MSKSIDEQIEEIEYKTPDGKDAPLGLFERNDIKSLIKEARINERYYNQKHWIEFMETRYTGKEEVRRKMVEENKRLEAQLKGDKDE